MISSTFHNLLPLGVSLPIANVRRKYNARFLSLLLFPHSNQSFHTSPTICCSSSSSSQEMSEPLLVVVGGGAAGVYAAIRAKSVAPHLGVRVIEKGRFLSKVKISGGGRCNVTNGHYTDKMALAEHYPRGNKELRGSFFTMHGPIDTMSWFSNHGVDLKIEKDGRVFPVTNSSSSIIDCLLLEARRSGVFLQAGKVVTNVSKSDSGKFLLKVEKRTIDFIEDIEADYLLIATGSSPQGYALAIQLGHSIIDPNPSLFTFKVVDTKLADLSGVSFPKVKANLKLQNIHRSIPQFTQVGPMLVTHWGLSGPVVLRLSAWGARDLYATDYTGMLFVDFLPDHSIEDVKQILIKHKDQLAKQKMLNSHPPQFGLVKRFWKYLLEREALDGDILWASVPKKSLDAVASLLKQCFFEVKGKITLNTMESRRQPHLFFAGEVLNVDGVTGGFNFQNAWSGGFIAGTAIGRLASGFCPEEL